MSKYEVIKESNKRDNYDLTIKNLINEEEYHILLVKLKDRIEKINEFKDGQGKLNYNNFRMIDLDFGEVFVNNIPSNLQNEEFYKFLLQYDGYLIRYFDESDITYDMCLEAIKSQPFSIRHIPNKFISDELIDTAISINGYSIMYVDDKKKTDDRCIRAYNNNPRAFRFVPKHLVTYDLCLEAVKRDMFCLEYVPDEYFIKVYKEAVVDRGLVIPRKGMPGVSITLIGQYRNIVNRIDRLGGISNNNQDNTLKEVTDYNEDERYDWLVNRREELLQELFLIENELTNYEETRAKNK